MQTPSTPEVGEIITFGSYAEPESESFSYILQPGQRCRVSKVDADNEDDPFLTVQPVGDDGEPIFGVQGDQIYLSEVQLDPAQKNVPTEAEQPVAVESASGTVNPDSQMDIEFHPLANALPLMDDAGIAELAADVKANGLCEEIVMLDGMVLDGRHRFLACQAAGIEPRFIDFHPSWGGDPAIFVVSRNLARRHLSLTQKALAAARLANTTRGGDRVSEQSANLHNDTSQAQAAEKLSVSRRSLNSAKKVLEAGTPELIEAVEAGTLPLFRAEAIAGKTKAEQQALAKANWKAPKGEAKPLGARAQADLNRLEAAWSEGMDQVWGRASKAARNRFLKNLKG